MRTGAEITVEGIAIAEGAHYGSILRILRRPDAPKPLKTIGRSKIYRTREVAVWMTKWKKRTARYRAARI